MNHLGTKYIETERLILRRFTIEDAEEMYRNWASDPEVTEYLTWPPHADVEVTKAVLTDWIQKYEDPLSYKWGIVVKESGELIGDISAKSIDKVNTANLGWCIGKKWWGKGYMPEAAEAVKAFLFDEVGFERLEAIHDADNPKSGRVMQKIGMVKEGVHRKRGRNNRGIIDEVWYAILREE